MRQKTINLRNQGSFDKKIDFFPQTLSHIPRWVRFVQKTRAKNSHAWAPLKKIRQTRVKEGGDYLPPILQQNGENLFRNHMDPEPHYLDPDPGFLLNLLH